MIRLFLNTIAQLTGYKEVLVLCLFAKNVDGYRLFVLLYCVNIQQSLNEDSAAVEQTKAQGNKSKASLVNVIG